MDETEMEIEGEQDGGEVSRDLASVADEHWEKRQYARCSELIVKKGFSSDNYEEDLQTWILKSNALACQLGIVTTGDGFKSVERQLSELLDHIQGVPARLDVVALDVVVTSNVLACILRRQFCLAKSSRNVQKCPNEANKYLVESLQRISDFLECANAQVDALNVRAVGLEILEKMRRKADSVLNLLGMNVALNCVVYYLLNKMPRIACEFINAYRSSLQDHSIFLPPTLVPSDIDFEIILNDCTKSVTCSQNSQLLSERKSPLEHLYIWSLFASGDYISVLEQLSISQLDFSCERLAYVKGFILFKQGRISECLKLCSNMKDRVATDSHCRWYNMLGCCLQSLGRGQTAVQVFSEGLSDDNGSLMPLYNMSLSYRAMGKSNAELQCLDLLEDALKKLNSQSPKDVNNGWVLCGSDVVQEAVFSPGIHSPQLLYVLAKRCLELKQFETASNKYHALISLLRSGCGVEIWQSFATDIKLPPLTVVHIELAYCLLKCKRYNECNICCNELLKATTDREMQISVTSSTSLTDSLSVPGTAPSSKRKRNAQLRSDLLLKRVSALMFQADAHASQCQFMDALSRLNDVIEISQEYLSIGETNESVQRCEGQNKSDSDSEMKYAHAFSTNPVYEILKDSFINKSCVLVALGNLQQALHISRLAVQLDPNCERSLYNHTLILVKLDRWKDACHAWLPKRGITPNPETLQQTLRSVQEKMQALECCMGEGDGACDVPLTQLSEVEKTRLDQYLLQVLEQKTNSS